jgi:hypothetical protein
MTMRVSRLLWRSSPVAGYKHGGFGAPDLPARSKKEQGRMT